MKKMKNERGAALALVVIFMSVLLAGMALAIDVGMGVLEKSRMQRAADSAALAGASKLPENLAAAYSEALDYCQRHGVAAGEVQVGLSMSYPTRIQVLITRRIDHAFARILGINQGTVAAKAQAETGVIGGMAGVIPIGVEEREFTYGDMYQLKRGAGTCEKEGTPGNCSNFGPLALGGFGASVYEYNLINGYNGIIRANDWVTTETGDMVGPTRVGINSRLDAGEGEAFPDFPVGTRRLVFLPIIESLDVGGRSEVLVVGFAAFYLEDFGSKGEVYGRFVRYHAPGEIYTPAEDFNLRGVKLVN